MTRCPGGHDSTEQDYCSVCGVPMDVAGAVGAEDPGAGGATPAAAPAAPVTGGGGQGQQCPVCGAAAAAEAFFCESCGYDYLTGSMPRGVQQAPAGDGAAAEAGPAASGESAAEPTDAQSGAEPGPAEAGPGRQMEATDDAEPVPGAQDQADDQQPAPAAEPVTTLMLDEVQVSHEIENALIVDAPQDAASRGTTAVELHVDADGGSSRSSSDVLSLGDPGGDVPDPDDLRAPSIAPRPPMPDVGRPGSGGQSYRQPHPTGRAAYPPVQPRPQPYVPGRVPPPGGRGARGYRPTVPPPGQRPGQVPRPMSGPPAGAPPVPGRGNQPVPQGPRGGGARTGGQPTSPPEVSVPTPRKPAPEAPAVAEVRGGATKWVAEIWIDPEWYRLQQPPEQLPSPGQPLIRGLRKTTVVIGRQSPEVRPDLDVVTDTGVSRRQAVLTTDGSRWFLEDLGSSNGTFVGQVDQSLPTQPISGRVELNLHDRIYVGSWTRIVVRPALVQEAEF